MVAGSAMAVRRRRSYRGAEAAIDDELLASDVGRGLGRKKHGSAGEIARLSPALERRPSDNPRDEGFVLQQALRQFGFEVAGRDGVAGDAMLAEVGSKRTHDPGQPA